MATSWSPTWRAELLPIGNGVRPVRSTLRTARSLLGSWATTVAFAVVPSWKSTVMFVAPSMTWLLVTM